MSTEHRRRVPRTSTENWPGSFAVEGESSSTSCEIVDISLLGVGIELTDSGPHAHLEGKRVVIEARPTTGTSVTLRLVGEVRNVREARSGRTRVGIEFDELSGMEQSILKVFELMKIFW